MQLTKGGGSPLFCSAISFLHPVDRFITNMKIQESVLFIVFSCFYIFLAWVVCGGDAWWIIDHVDSTNVFYGDDAYRFFLARSAWIEPDLYTYNFALPGFLFLDGIVTFIAGGDIFYARAIHGFLAAASLVFIWRTGCLLGIRDSIMLPAIFIMGLLPRFALTSLSFYGEAWLVFLVCPIAYFYLDKRFRVVALIASILPLVRPEGMFLWIPLWVSMLLARRWFDAALMLLPGFIYFVYINIALDSLIVYGFWRIELRAILNKLVLSGSGLAWLNTYSFWLVIPAFLGVTFRPIRTLWPLLVGGGLWLCWLVILIAGGYSDYEDRYTFLLIPLLILLWGAFAEWLCSQKFLSKVSCNRMAGLVYLSAAIIIFSHLHNMFMIRESVRLVGAAPVIKSIIRGDWDKIFMYHSQSEVKAWREGADYIERMIKNDKGIDQLIIFDHGFYYFLDPYKLNNEVTVGYATNGYRVFHVLFDGQVFAQHPGGEMYSYFDFDVPTFSHNEKRAIYVDLMPLKGYPFTKKFGEYQIHLFAYSRFLKPKKDIKNAPMVDLDIMKEAYNKWW